MLNQSIKNAAELPTSSIVTVRRNAAVFSKVESIFLKFLMPDAAKVRIGPAEIAFTRIPSFPKSAASRALQLQERLC